MAQTTVSTTSSFEARDLMSDLSLNDVGKLNLVYRKCGFQIKNNNFGVLLNLVLLNIKKVDKTTNTSFRSAIYICLWTLALITCSWIQSEQYHSI